MDKITQYNNSKESDTRAFTRIFEKGGLILLEGSNRFDKLLNFVKSGFFVERTGTFTDIVNASNKVIETLFIHDKENPIVTPYGDKAYFYPDQRHIIREGFEKAELYYAVHIVTATSSIDKNKREFDRSKAKAIDDVISTLAIPDSRYYQQNNDGTVSTIYVKRVCHNKNVCSVLRAELESDGHIRFVTIMPDQTDNGIKKKASNIWNADAFKIGLRVDKSPSSAEITDAKGESNINNHNEDNNNFDNNKTKATGGKLKPKPAFMVMHICSETGGMKRPKFNDKAQAEKFAKEVDGEVIAI